MDLSDEQTKSTSQDASNGQAGRTTKKSAKKAARKSFSQADKSAALKMLVDGHTLKQTAEHFGCSVASLQQWKAKHKPTKASKKVAKKGKVAKKTTRKAKPMHTATHREGFKQFVRGYFEQDHKVSEILTSPPVEGFDLLFKVNDALSFAYDYFNK